MEAATEDVVAWQKDSLGELHGSVCKGTIFVEEVSAKQDVLVDFEDREMVMVEVEEVLVSGGLNFDSFLSIFVFSLIASSFYFLATKISFFM